MEDHRPAPASWIPTDLSVSLAPDGFKVGSPAPRRAKVAEWLMRRPAEPLPGGSIPSLGWPFYAGGGSRVVDAGHSSCASRPGGSPLRGTGIRFVS